MVLLSQYFPIANPTLIFLVVLLIILFAPIIMGKLRIPHIIGMVIAGVLVGEYGLNILERDSSFELFGRVGLLYIMFLAGLEMDLRGARSDVRRYLFFGALTFLLPFILIFLMCVWLLSLQPAEAALISCIMSANTLVAYPIITRYGLQRHKAVTLSVGATMISFTIALLVLAAITEAYHHERGLLFWHLFFLKVALFCSVELLAIPRLSRWFLSRYADPVMQFVFVLSILFLSAWLSEIAGLEGIFGAFFSGLVLNRYIPRVSPLMNRIEFIGNALFIPWFLIGVGMMINISSLFTNITTVIIVFCLVFFGTAGKAAAAYTAAFATRMKITEGHMMFGLTSAHAAGAIAMMLVGMNLEMAPGVPLMDNNMLNAVVCMVLFTCVISSIVTEKSAKSLLLEEMTGETPGKEGDDEKLLIVLEHAETEDTLIDLAVLMRNEKLNRGMIGLNVVYDDINSARNQIIGRRVLEKAARRASASDVRLITQGRIATNISNGIAHAFQEYDASEIIMDLHRMKSASDSFWGRYAQDVIARVNRQVLLARINQPVNTLRRIHIAVPSKAEYEPGFHRWMERLSRMAENLECRVIVHAKQPTLSLIQQYISNRRPKVRAEYLLMAHWDQMPQIARMTSEDQLLILVTARKGTMSWKHAFENIPSELTHNMPEGNIIIIFPDQYGEPEETMTFAAPQLNGQQNLYYQLMKWLKLK